MPTLTIDRSLDLPVYEQVADQIRRLIASGELAPGAVLPSVRQLARDLAVNLNTVARAYRRLEGEGFLVIRKRSGVEVAAPAHEIDRAARSTLLDQLRVSLARLRQAGMPTEELIEVTRSLVRGMDGDGREERR
jgi:GntR family transcriptional regulator